MNGLGRANSERGNESLISPKLRSSFELVSIYVVRVLLAEAASAPSIPGK